MCVTPTGVAIAIACIIFVIFMVAIDKIRASVPPAPQPQRARPEPEMIPRELRSFGGLRDINELRQPLCRACGGARNYHASIQGTRPHPFVKGPLTELLPYEAGPHWEGGLPLLN